MSEKENRKPKQTLEKVYVNLMKKKTIKEDIIKQEKERKTLLKERIHVLCRTYTNNCQLC